MKIKTVKSRKELSLIKNTEIYSKKSDGNFYTPFSLIIDDMEHLILINFEKDPDEFYHTFEVQRASDRNHLKFLLVIAYRKDGGTDVYHQPGYPFCSQASILNDVSFWETPLRDAKFEVNPDQLDVFFSFTDKYGRKIEVRTTENRKPKKNPFFLLAPVGVVSRRPASLPVYSLYEMSFTPRKHTIIEIGIDGVKHRPDTFPLPIDRAKNYFTRYSADTFLVDFNRNYDGPLLPLVPGKNNRAGNGTVVYDLVNNDGHYETECMSAANGKHQVKVCFSPPVPDIECLKSKVSVNGSFTITTDNTTGSIRGEYHLNKPENVTELLLLPNKGWIPREKRCFLKLLFLFAGVFRNWPKSYVWHAKIYQETVNPPVMRSGWKRIQD